MYGRPSQASQIVVVSRIAKSSHVDRSSGTDYVDSVFAASRGRHCVQVYMVVLPSCVSTLETSEYRP